MVECWIHWFIKKHFLSYADINFPRLYIHSLGIWPKYSLIRHTQFLHLFLLPHLTTNTFIFSFLFLICISTWKYFISGNTNTKLYQHPKRFPSEKSQGVENFALPPDDDDDIGRGGRKKQKRSSVGWKPKVLSPRMLWKATTFKSTPYRRVSSSLENLVITVIRVLSFMDRIARQEKPRGQRYFAHVCHRIENPFFHASQTFHHYHLFLSQL